MIRHQQAPCCNASDWRCLHRTLRLAYENPRPACHETAHRGSSLCPKKPSFHASIHVLDLSTAYVYTTVYDSWPHHVNYGFLSPRAISTESAQATVTLGKPWPTSCAGCKVGMKSCAVVTGIPKRTLISEVTGDCVWYKKSSGGGNWGRPVSQTSSYGIYDAVNCQVPSEGTRKLLLVRHFRKPCIEHASGNEQSTTTRASDARNTNI